VLAGVGAVRATARSVTVRIITAGVAVAPALVIFCL
jgi:hypothetical protein